MGNSIAWLSGGRIRVRNGESEAITVESRFATEFRDKAARANQRHEWKARGDSGGILPSAALWGRGAGNDPSTIRTAVTSVAGGSSPGELFYTLHTDAMSAVLCSQNFGESERRVWNKNGQFLDQISVGPNGSMAGTIRRNAETANIAVRVGEEGSFSEVTEGDSFDASPRWVDGDPDRLLFASAGVARDGAGRFAGWGPFQIQLLNVTNGHMETLAEDSRHDLLAPAMASDGSLYYIRRPYAGRAGLNPAHFIKDVLFFPFRLLLAFFGYLNFFSMRYTGKKLARSGDAAARQPEIREMMMWGNLVRAQSATKDDDAPDLVSRDWKLARRSPGGEETILAHAALGFDVGAEGEIVFTNGSAVFYIAPGGAKTRIAADGMIRGVAFLRGGR
jgi:hypothetical protein